MTAPALHDESTVSTSASNHMLGGAAFELRAVGQADTHTPGLWVGW